MRKEFVGVMGWAAPNGWVEAHFMSVEDDLTAQDGIIRAFDTRWVAIVEDLSLRLLCMSVVSLLLLQDISSFLHYDRSTSRLWGLLVRHSQHTGPRSDCGRDGFR